MHAGDGRVVVTGADDTVLVLLPALERQRVVPHALRVEAGSLDTAYLDLTAGPIEENV